LAIEVVLHQKGRTKPNILILTETKLLPQATWLKGLRLKAAQAGTTCS
jgi:hypothetical protein